MKKASKKLSSKNKTGKMNKIEKREPRAKKIAKVEDLSLVNTKGAEMPDPASRNRPLRKDVRFAFR